MKIINVLKEIFDELRETHRRRREYWRNIDTTDSKIIVYEKEEFWFDNGMGKRITFTDERGRPMH